MPFGRRDCAAPRSLRRACLVLVTFLWLCMGTASTRAAVLSEDGTLPVDDYRRELDATWTLVIQLRDTPDPDAGLLAGEASAWEAIHAIALPDGSTLPVDHDYLVALLRADPPRLAEAEALLDALRSADVAGVPYVFAAHEQQSLDAVLAQPEFQWVDKQPSALELWWERLKQAFLDWLQRLLGGGDSTVAAGGGFPVGSFVVALVCGVFLLALLLYVLRGLRGGVSSEALLETGDDAGEPLTSGAALQRARTFSSGGDYRTAVRYLYLSTLLLLDERGLFTYDQTLTNREYARSLEKTPKVAGVFSSVVDVFDRVWYGSQPIDAETYDDYSEKITELSEES